MHLAEVRSESNATELLERFSHEIDVAVAWTAKRCDEFEEDLRMFAVQVILEFGNGERNWHQDERRLTPDADSSVNRMVQRALNFALLHDTNRNSAQAGNQVSLDEIVENGQEYAYGLDSPASPAQTDENITDYLEMRFPLLMQHYVNGQTVREIAMDMGVSHGKILYRIEKEHSEFMALHDYMGDQAALAA